MLKPYYAIAEVSDGPRQTWQLFGRELPLHEAIETARLWNKHCAPFNYSAVKVDETGIIHEITNNELEQYRASAGGHAEMQAMRLAGATKVDIARAFGVSKQRVHQIVGADRPRGGKAVRMARIRRP